MSGNERNVLPKPDKVGYLGGTGTNEQWLGVITTGGLIFQATPQRIIKYDSGTNQWKYTNNGTNYFKITGEEATQSTSGLMSSGDKTKLDGIETGATADQTDAEIEIGYNNRVPIVTQAEAEAGTSTTVKRWTPLRVKQAITALAQGGGDMMKSVYDTDNDGKVENADQADLATDSNNLGGNTPSFFRNASNLNAGTVARQRLGALWRDSISDETQNPYIQTGQKDLPASSATLTITFDIQYTAIPRVFFSQWESGYTVCLAEVTATYFKVTRHPTMTNKIDWVAVGRKN